MPFPALHGRSSSWVGTQESWQRDGEFSEWQKRKQLGSLRRFDFVGRPSGGQNSDKGLACLGSPRSVAVGLNVLNIKKSDKHRQRPAIPCDSQQVPTLYAGSTQKQFPLKT